MDSKINTYLSLANIFRKNGFQLFLVGGTVRDYLLNIPLTDMDAVTDATPDEVRGFLDADFTFSKYGSISYKHDGVKFDITTLRKEESYADSRHPNEIIFVKDLSTDVVRRDFTINAMYLDINLTLIDYYHGRDDLRNKILRMVGEPVLRLKEDPLRIIRAIRFSLDFDLTIEESLDKAIRDNIDLLNNLNPEKIKQDVKKIRCSNKEKISKVFQDYNIKLVLDMLE